MGRDAIIVGLGVGITNFILMSYLWRRSMNTQFLLHVLFFKTFCNGK